MMGPVRRAGSSTALAISRYGVLLASMASGAPKRDDRKRCWDARDAYFLCLDKANILAPGSETGKLCSKERKNYDGACAKSWVEYFDKKRVLDARQKAMMEALEAQNQKGS